MRPYRTAPIVTEVIRRSIASNVFGSSRGLPRDPSRALSSRVPAYESLPERRVWGRGKVGAVQPFERLRYLARWSEDDGPELLSEAADCLAAFGGDPAGLVVACRRLLAHHPSTATLWWLCSQVLAAPDAGRRGVDGVAGLQRRRDPRPPRRRAPLPPRRPGRGARLARGGRPRASAERPDLDVVAVRSRAPAPTSSRRRLRDDGATGAGRRRARAAGARAVAPPDRDRRPRAAGVRSSPPGAIDLAAAARSHGAKVWLVAGLGRVLPERLFQSLLRPSARRRTGS